MPRATPTRISMLCAVSLTSLFAAPARGQDSALPSVVVLTTGGTIASRPGGQLPGDSLVDAVPQLLEHATVRVEEISRIGSSQMTPNHWLILTQRINQLFREDAQLAGVVITHGTDTLDETAFFLNLTVHDARPVVVVGSMRAADAISADGPANLVNAVRVATSPASVGKGVLVVLNENIGAARDVWKTNNLRVDTFKSPEFGYLGLVDPDTVLFYRESLHPHTTQSSFYVDGLDSLPRVDIVPDYTGSDGAMLDFLSNAMSEGVVVATFAGGRMSAGTQEGVKVAAERGVPVVLASRVPGGRIIGNPAERFGVNLARDLSPYKARILLMLALTRTRDVEEIQKVFDTY